MTREERNDAIEFFKNVAEKEVNNAKYSKLAIKALEQEPCDDDAISRQAVLEITAETRALETQARVKALPHVTPQPCTDAEIQKMQELEQAEIQKAYELGKAEQQKMGRWIYTGDYITDGMLKCSECGFEHDVSERFSYCPNCGAKMQEVEE